MVFDIKAWQKSPTGIRSRIKKNWKFNGIIHNQGLDYLYDNIYLPATHCEKCNIDFGSDGYRSRKCCDHNHAILDSHNFSSVTDNGTGDHTVNFSNNMSSINFASLATVSSGSKVFACTQSKAVGSVRVKTIQDDGVLRDEAAQVLIFGD